MLPNVMQAVTIRKLHGDQNIVEVKGAHERDVFAGQFANMLGSVSKLFDTKLVCGCNFNSISM